jgi:integrase
MQRASFAAHAERAHEFAKRSRADNTRRAYEVQWEQFADWCAAQGVEALPCQPLTLASYIAARALDRREDKPVRKGRTERGTKVLFATLSQALTAINNKHVAHGYERPRSFLAVQTTLEGIKRTLGIEPTRKAPVLAETLSRMVEVLPNTLGGARDRALLLVGFLGAFRRSELVSLEVSDLTFSRADGLVVRLRKSKTDQHKVGRSIALAKQVDADVCPMRATQAWLERAGIADGLVFRSVDRHGNLGASLGAKDVARVVKRTAAAAGIDTADLAGHSLRAGLATEAAQQGARATQIMKQTGHTNVEMVSRYIREAELFKDNVTTGMMRSARRAVENNATGERT